MTRDDLIAAADGCAFDDDVNDDRVLVIDGSEPTHADFRRILVDDGSPIAGCELDSARQCEGGVELVEGAIESDRPYALVFIDMDSSSDWNGVSAVERICELDPDVQIVLCTADADSSWSRVQARLGSTDRAVILRKPYSAAEVGQIAGALVKKWHVTRQATLTSSELHQMVTARTADLAEANYQLSQTNETIERTLEEKLDAESQLRHDAFHDRLTDLPNRALLTERIDRCIERSKRQEGFRFALLFIDLDDFKSVNDSLGHGVGDQLLVGISRRITTSLRLLDTASRPADDTTARLGGDEFVVLLDGIQDAASARLVAERILHELAKPFNFAGQEVTVSASIGVATNDLDYEQPSEIICNADIAMYEAKNSGKNRCAVFDKGMHDTVKARLQVEDDLRAAIDRSELELQYQPIVSLESGEIVSLEALLRWRHPDHGPVPPDDFIPIAEETGAIVEIGLWVFSEACRQLQLWREMFPTRKELAINVNVSPQQIVHADLLDQLKCLQATTGADLGHVRFEITEPMVMENRETIKDILSSIKALGIQIQIDDFGTGNSSLSYLDNLEVDALKIDRTFVNRLHRDRSALASVQAMVQLAHTRNLRVVAEGVETHDAMVQLQALGCDLAQGYFFSRPLDVQAINALLAADICWLKNAA